VLVGTKLALLDEKVKLIFLVKELDKSLELESREM
jgi:hypothetical protein